MGYSSKNVVKNGESQAVASGAAAQVVTGEGARECFYISAAFMTAACFDIVCSDVVVGAGDGITAKLQVRYSDTQAWQDSKTVAITANGTTSLRLLDAVSGDQTYLPLKPQARIVITAANDASCTVDAVFIPYC